MTDGLRIRAGEGFGRSGLAVRLVLAAVAMLAPAMALGQASDLIDTLSLGERGVLLQGYAASSAVRAATALGDVNGDGYSDFGVVAHGETGSGRAYLISGRPWSERNALLWELEDAVDFSVFDTSVTKGFPWTVRPAGDLNGDGLSDVLMVFGWNYRRTPEATTGVILLVWGHRNLLSGEYFDVDVPDFVPGVVLWSTDQSFFFIGKDVRVLGDINGDGHPDLGMFVSSLMGDQVRVLFGIDSLPASGLIDIGEIGTTLPGVVVRLDPMSHPSSTSLATLGDFDGDGIDDFAVSDYFSLYVILGRRDFPPRLELDRGTERPDVIAIKGPDTDHLSFAKSGQIAGIGDLDGDGLGDLLVGCTSIHQLNMFSGAGLRNDACIIYGRRDFPRYVEFYEIPEGLCTWISAARDPLRHTAFGKYVAGAGDLDLDGVPDLLIGAPWTSVGSDVSAGKGYVIHGRQDFGPVLDLTRPYDGIEILGHGYMTQHGTVIEAAGDIDADGAPDILMTAPRPSEGSEGDRSKLYVIYGSAEGKPPLTLLSVRPEAGSVRGGTSVTLRGSGFSPGARVEFGARRSGQVTVVSPIEIRALAPPGGEPGEVVDVSVEVDGARRTLSAGYVYTRSLPEIDLVDPGPRGLRLLGRAYDGSDWYGIGTSLSFGEVTGDGVDDLLVFSLVPGGWLVSVVQGGRDLPERMDLFDPEGGFGEVFWPLDETASGQVLAVVGDVDGDGIEDFAMSSWQSLGYLVLGGGHLRGGRHVLGDLIDQGRGSVLRPDASRATDYFYMRFAPLGDLDEDGIDDFALSLSGSQTQPGELLIVAGRSSWPEDLELATAPGILSRVRGMDNRYFSQMAPAGDFDGDGNEDLIVMGATAARGTTLYVIYGGSGLPVSTNVISLVSEGRATRLRLFGRRWAGEFLPAGAGDMDGDGYADIIMGVMHEGGGFEGLTYVLRGGPERPEEIDIETSERVLEILGPSDEAYSGSVVGPAGDFDGDGHSDVYVASLDAVDPFFERPPLYHLIFGRRDLPRTMRLDRLRGAGVVIHGAESTCFPGGPLQRSGDLDGDGIQDLAFCETPVAPPPGATFKAGSVFVVYGLSREVEFVRGDANADGAVDISDAIFVLYYLFLGGEAPSCEDAADTDDSGRLDLTDAISLLLFLFQGGPEPPPPHPEPGADPTADDLGCVGR